MKKTLSKVVLSSLLVVMFATTSYAIECNGRYQVMRDGSEINTPYCNHNYLAYVARKYGLKHTNREVRNNPSLTEKICDFIGHDNRVTDICESTSTSSIRLTQ